MASKLPWMKFWGRDFFNDQAVKEMDNALVGAYVRLLWDAWEHDGLPADPHRVARLAAVQPLEVGPLLDLFPIAEDGRRRNPRQERERAEAMAEREGKARGGKAASGNLRKGRAFSESSGSPSGSAGESPGDSPSGAVDAVSRLRASPASTASGNGSLEENSPEKEGGLGGRIEQEIREGLADSPEGLGLYEMVLLDCRGPTKRFAFSCALRALGPGGANQAGEWVDVAVGLRQAVKGSDGGKVPNDNYLASCVANAKRTREGGTPSNGAQKTSKSEKPLPDWYTPPTMLGTDAGT